MHGKGTRLRIAHGGLILAGLVALVFQTGCGKDSTTQPITEFDPPHSLTYINHSGSVHLTWGRSSDEGKSDFKEYAVFRSEARLDTVPDSRFATHRIGASGTNNFYDDNTAVNGVKYYYAVRGIKDNGDMSALTADNQIDTAARRESLPNTVAEFAYASQPSGINTANGQAVVMSSSDPDNRSLIDVYLGTTATDDASTAPLALKSPSLVGGTHASDWDTRVAQLKTLDSWDASTTTDAGWTDEIELGATPAAVNGKVIAVRTPSVNGIYHYAKIQFSNMAGNAGQRTVSIQVAYQDVPNYVRFSR